MYYRDSEDGSWIQIATDAQVIDAADFDGDGIDDPVGAWPNSGVWIKKSSEATWERLSFHLPDDLAAGDMNGDGLADLVGTWPNSGTYWKDTNTGTWTQMAQPADRVAVGDMDADGKADLVGVWMGSGVFSKTSSDQTWNHLSSSVPQDIAAGKMTGGSWGGTSVSSVVPVLDFHGKSSSPGFRSSFLDSAKNGPGGSIFNPRIQKNIFPRISGQSVYLPGPGEPGFTCIHEKNLLPRKDLEIK
jgi:hypothetical protein